MYTSPRELWIYRCKANNPVCAAFVLFTMPMGHSGIMAAVKEGRQLAKEEGITNIGVNESCSMLGYFAGEEGQSQVLLSATGEY